MITDNKYIDIAHTISLNCVFEDGRKNYIKAMLEFAEAYHELELKKLRHNDSYLLGLEDAIEQIMDEYDCCKMHYEEQEENLNTIKMAFSRAIGLIEDRMIQHKSKIKMNQFVDEFNRL